MRSLRKTHSKTDARGLTRTEIAGKELKAREAREAREARGEDI
jgi:hypothetical protein